MELQEVIREYSDNYFDEDTIEVFKNSIKLLQMVQNGSFEYDTWVTDKVLTDLRDAINRIDI